MRQKERKASSPRKLIRGESIYSCTGSTVRVRPDFTEKGVTIVIWANDNWFIPVRKVLPQGNGGKQSQRSSKGMACSDNRIIGMWWYLLLDNSKYLKSDRIPSVKVERKKVVGLFCCFCEGHSSLSRKKETAMYAYSGCEKVSTSNQ